MKIILKEEGKARKRKQILAAPKIIITGTPKSGKTTVAAMFPDVMFFNAEKGADVHNVGLLNPDSTDILVQLEHVLTSMNEGTMKGGKLTFKLKGQDLTIGAFCIDSLDAIQIGAIQHKKAHSSNGQLRQNDWGEILDRFTALFVGTTPIFNVPIPMILTAHQRVIEPVWDVDKDGNQTLQASGKRIWAVQGSLSTKLDRFFDYIIHLVYGTEVGAKEAERLALIEPIYVKSSHFYAGDRTGVLKKLTPEGKGKMINMDEDEKNPGYPKIDLMAAIVKAHKW